MLIFVLPLYLSLLGQINSEHVYCSWKNLMVLLILWKLKWNKVNWREKYRKVQKIKIQYENKQQSLRRWGLTALKWKCISKNISIAIWRGQFSQKVKMIRNESWNSKLHYKRKGMLSENKIWELQCFTDGLRPNGFNAF